MLKQVQHGSRHFGVQAHNPSDPERNGPRNRNLNLNLSTSKLLSDTHQREDPCEPKEQGRGPGRKEGWENSGLSNGKENVEGHAIGKADHYTDADA